jgi:uncharacterized membrane protein
MTRLEKQLETWREAGLISAEQLQQIRQFEVARPRKSWGVWGVLGIGATAVATGVVSVIAANWDAIGPYTKLLCYFALQATLSVALFRRRAIEGPVRELLITGSALGVLAGIGLIGQVYHLRSDGWQGLLLWLMLTLPLTLLAEGKLLPYLWVAGAWLTSWIWADTSRGWLSEADRSLIASAVPLGFAALGLVPAHWRLAVRFREASLVWGLLGSCAVGSLVANVAWASGFGYRSELPGIGAGIFGALSLLCVLAVQSRRQLPVLARAAVSAMFAFLAVGCTLPVLTGGNLRSEIVGAVVFLLVWSAAAFGAAQLEYKRLFDLASVVIALRFVVIYFEVFGSLAATGFGLIVSGGVIIGVALAWHRLRLRVRSRLEARS